MKVNSVSAGGAMRCSSYCTEETSASDSIDDAASLSSSSSSPPHVLSARGSTRPRRTRGRGVGGRGARYLFGSRVSLGGEPRPGVASSAAQPGRPSRGSRGSRGPRGFRGTPVAVGTRRIGGVPVPVESGSFKGALLSF